MKRFSDYFKIMMLISLIMLVCFILSTPQIFDMPDSVGSACATFAFIFWFAGVMAPDHEKYKENSNRR